jgi:hypothetical protein
MPITAIGGSLLHADSRYIDVLLHKVSTSYTQWQLRRTWEEFLALCKDIRAANRQQPKVPEADVIDILEMID